jgi:putative RecB family exonuclease
MIVTHNTGKVPAPNDRFLDEKFFAMRVYALLWHTVHGELPYELRLIYVAGGTRDSVRRVRVDEALLKRVRAELKGAYTEMQRAAKDGQFACKRQPLCQWCDYIDLCPQWHPELAGMAPGELRAMHVDGQPMLLDPK